MLASILQNNGADGSDIFGAAGHADADQDLADNHDNKPAAGEALVHPSTRTSGDGVQEGGQHVCGAAEEAGGGAVAAEGGLYADIQAEMARLKGNPNALKALIEECID